MSDAVLTDRCPKCSAAVRVSARHQGKTVQCPKCATPWRVALQIPEGSEEATVKASAVQSAQIAPSVKVPSLKTTKTVKAPTVAAGASAAGLNEPVVGGMLGGFEIVRVIGRGNMGPVFEARDQLLARSVAVKLLPAPVQAGGPTAVADFLRGANVSNKLEHPAILTVYQAGKDGDTCFFVEELVRGGSAADFIKQYGRMTPADAVRVVRAAARGVAAAHERGVIHGNLTPNNILLGQEWAIKVSDFGLAMALERCGAVKRGDLPAEFFSPEHCRDRPVEPRSDVYSLGAILFHLLVGAPPFPHADRADVYASHVATPPPDPRRFAEGVPDDIAEIVVRSLAKDPDDRFASAAEMAGFLESWEAGSAAAAQGFGALAAGGAANAGADDALAAFSTMPDPAPRSPKSVSVKALPAARAKSAKAVVPTWAVYSGLAGIAAVLIVVLVIAFSGKNDPPPQKLAKNDEPKIEDPRPDPTAGGTPDPVPVDPPPVQPDPTAKAEPAVGERFAEYSRRIDEMFTRKAESDEVGKVLVEFREFGRGLRGSSAPNARAFAEEVDRFYRKSYGDYYTARLDMKLPKPNTAWPKLDSVPNSGGFYQLLEGRRAHLTPFSDGNVVVRSEELWLDEDLFLIGREVPPFRDFELRYKLRCYDEEAMAGPYYRFRFDRKIPPSRVYTGNDRVELYHGLPRNNESNDPIRAHKFDGSSEGWTDVRVIVRAREHHVFINGVSAFKVELDDTNVGRFGIAVHRGRVQIRELALAVFDRAPPSEFSDEAPTAGRVLGSGTGWVVAPGGYLMTNHHVVDGPGQVTVSIPGQKDPVPADVIASDKDRDMAIIKLRDPAGFDAKPVPIAAARKLRLGERVAAFGFPLGTSIGTGVKLTTGVISAVPEAANENMYLLDVKVNPGNSGGPLCDSFGNAVGMVTAKSFGGGRIDSYGLALPADDLAAFAKRHIPNLRESPALTQRMEWDEVAAGVRPSVFMILKVR